MGVNYIEISKCGYFKKEEKSHNKIVNFEFEHFEHLRCKV